MKMDYSQTGVAQGRINQAKAQEQPNTFSTESGVDQISLMSALDKPKQRMAGQIPNRVKEYLTDPNERARTDIWMNLFGVSVPGAEFNAAKMGGGLPPQ